MRPFARFELWGNARSVAAVRLEAGGVEPPEPAVVGASTSGDRERRDVLVPEDHVAMQVVAAGPAVYS